MDVLWETLPDGTRIDTITYWRASPGGAVELLRGGAALAAIRETIRSGQFVRRAGGETVTQDPYSTRMMDLVEKVGGFTQALLMVTKALDESRTEVHHTSEALLVLSGKFDRSLERMEQESRSVTVMQVELQEKFQRVVSRVDILEKEREQFVKKDDLARYTSTVNVIQVTTQLFEKVVPWAFAAASAVIAAHAAGIKFW